MKPSRTSMPRLAPPPDSVVIMPTLTSACAPMAASDMAPAMANVLNVICPSPWMQAGCTPPGLCAPHRGVTPCIPQVWTKVQMSAASGPASARAGRHETHSKSTHFVDFDMHNLPRQTDIGPKHRLPRPVGHQTPGLLIAVIGQRRHLFHETQAAHHGIAADCDRSGIKHLLRLALGENGLLIALGPDPAHHGA